MAIYLTERFIFFNSAPGDARMYQAADFADYFGSVLSTGLLHTDKVPGMAVAVVAGTLTTKISAGKAIMRGHLYENTADLTLTHSIPEPTLDRIDRVVLRLDLRNSERNIKLHVKAGVAADVPVAPTLQRDNFIYELSLARVLVRKNTVQLLAGDLVDERLNEAVCGLVYSLISIPTAQFQAQWDAFMVGIQDSGFASAEELATHMAESTTGAHKGTNISFAPPVGMTAINVQTAIQEVFQSGNSRKIEMVNALLLVDPSLPITTSSTWSEIELAVGMISTGKKWKTGEINSASGTVTGLGFRPAYVITYTPNTNSYIKFMISVSKLDTGFPYGDRLTTDTIVAQGPAQGNSDGVSYGGNIISATSDGFNYSVLDTTMGKRVWIAFE